MSLEQRVEALEKEIAGMKKAAQKQAAKFESKSFGIYDQERDNLLDVAATLTLDSQHLSRL